MILKVTIKPGSDREFLEEIGRGEFIAEVKEKPEDGKANQKMINLIAKEFGVLPRQVSIKNPESSEKIVEITSLLR